MGLASVNSWLRKLPQRSLRGLRSSKVAIFVPIESPYDFLLVNDTNFHILSGTVSKILPSIGQIFTVDRRGGGSL